MKIAEQSSVRNDEQVLLVGFCIRYTLEKSGKWIGKEKGGNKLHCYNLAMVIMRRQVHGSFLTFIN